MSKEGLNVHLSIFANKSFTQVQRDHESNYLILGLHSHRLVTHYQFRVSGLAKPNSRTCSADLGFSYMHLICPCRLCSPYRKPFPAVKLLLIRCKNFPVLHASSSWFRRSES